ncbi:MAG TPA: winged helix-turn-helix transcriptional regulator [Sphingomicrobium sp.]|nr:winged helix-turn-helix transcriptional regulator [Sphingomicrobium sp.]
MELEKITKSRQSEEKRRYEDACGVAHALELIGERWAPLVLRELMFGPRRFSELRADLPGISANVLTQRLSELEARGLIRKVQLPPPASVQVYEATEWGLEAAPVMRALGRWAVRSPAHDPGRFVSAVSIMMSMQTMFDAARAGDLNARIGFRFGETQFVADIRDGSIDVRRGEADGADVAFVTEPGQLAGVLYGGAPLETVDVKGDMAVAKRFVTLFPLPPKIG